MNAAVAATVIAAYVSLAIELTLLHVPSVASSRGIWASRSDLVSAYSPRYRRIFAWPRALKLVVLGVPLLAAYAAYALPLVVLWRGADPLGDYVFTPSSTTDLAGLALVVAGRALALGAVLTIRRGNQQTGNSFRLHVSGPFRWSRNPGLVGMYLFIGGLWLITPSLAMLAAIVLYVTYMDFKVRMEEDFLANKFGSSYHEYRLRTGRYLP